MCVGDFDATNDLTGIDVCDSGRAVGVRVRTNDVCAASSEVVVLAEEVACDSIRVLGSIEGGRYVDVDRLETSVGEVGPETKGLSANEKSRWGQRWREGVSEAMCGEASQGEGDGSQTAHGWGGGETGLRSGL